MPPFSTVKRLTPGGLGEVLVLQDAAGLKFVGKFPKDNTPDQQRLIFDEQRRFVRHQCAQVVAYFGEIAHADGRRGFAMELMDGSLASHVATKGALPEAEAVAFMSDVLRGLVDVHRSAPGANHGDLKLANILLKGGRAKLADFGLARGGVGQTESSSTHQGGTPGYRPPEGWTSPAGDVYSLGVVFWAMLAGKEPPPYRPTVAVTMKRDIAELITDMTKVQAIERPDVTTVAQRLDVIRKRVGVAATPANTAGDDWLTDLLKVAAVVGGVIAGGAILAAALKEE